MSTTRTIEDISRSISGGDKVNITEKMRALSDARQVGDLSAVNALIGGLKDPSVLLKHEIAYTLGQLQFKEAIPVLCDLLKNESENEVVRHEAAEALNAIGDTKAEIIDLVEKFTKDKSVPVSETCKLSHFSLKKKAASKIEGKEVRFRSVDPVLPEKKLCETSVEVLEKQLSDSNLDICLRYEAMFALRNIESAPSTEALARELCRDKTSALFRHEIAFVLGQLQAYSSLDSLSEALANEEDHPMVRHEAALAIGSIGKAVMADTEKQERVRNVLRKFLDHKEPIVSESCAVGLDYMT